MPWRLRIFRACTRPYHIHRYQMTTRDWIFICKCGNTCYNSHEALKRTLVSSARSSIVSAFTILLAGLAAGSLAVYIGVKVL